MLMVIVRDKVWVSFMLRDTFIFRLLISLSSWLGVKFRNLISFVVP